MNGESEARERAALDEVIDRLAKAYQGHYPVEVVAKTVADVHGRFAGRPIRDFVPVLVERLVRQELDTQVAPERAGIA